MLERNIVTSLATVELTDYLCSQLSVFFPDKGILKNDLLKIVFKSFQRTINCFSYIKGKHYNDAKHVYFNHLHGDRSKSMISLLSFKSKPGWKDGNFSRRLFSKKGRTVFSAPIGTVWLSVGWNKYILLTLYSLLFRCAANSCPNTWAPLRIGEVSRIRTLVRSIE